MKFYSDVFRMHFQVIKATSLEDAYNQANTEIAEVGDFMARTLHSWTLVKKIKKECIYIMFNPNYVIDSGTIAHEALHAVNFMFKARGVTIDTTNDEVQAYFLEWMVDNITKYV